MDERLAQEQIDRQFQRRALALIARAVGIVEPGLNPWYPDFTHAANGMTGYHSPDGTWGAFGSDDEHALAHMRELTQVAYARQRDSEKRAQARSQSRPDAEAFVALTFGFLEVCRQGTPDKPWPRNFLKRALAHAELSLTDPTDRTRTAQRLKALAKMTKPERNRARAIAFEACFPVKAAEERFKKQSES